VTARRNRRLVIVGGGPAGVAAAIEARRAGLETCLVEQRSSLPTDESLPAECEVLLDTAAWGLWGRDLALCGPNAHSSLVTFDYLIVATGAFERTVAFPGWTLAGVSTLDDVRGERVVVAGYGTPLTGALHSLASRGIRVTATLDASSRLPVRAEGDDHLERLVSMAVDATWSPRPGTEQTIEADSLVLAFGSVPEDRLLRLAGCAFDGSPFVNPSTRCDAWMRTSVAGVLAAGDAGGIVADADAAADQGRLAALAVAMDAGCIDVDEAERRAESIPLNVAQLMTELPRDGLFELADHDTVICACESVTAGQVSACIYPGSLEPAGVIAETRATMGICQGRKCASLVAGVLARQAGVALDQIPPITPRPPVVPVPIGALAERPPVFPPLSQLSAAR
jgi:thioredoxin reductase